MIYTDMTKKAMKLIIKAHSDQKDKAGLPYFLHPIIVADSMEDEISTTVALLHDVIEDTNLTLKDLKDEGFNDEVINAVTLLTHDEDIPYIEYIDKIKTNPIAVRVKLYDLKHNMDLGRIDNITKRDLERIEKYKEAYKRLIEE